MRYKDLGVDIYKRGIEYFKLDNLFPGAFCTIVKNEKNPSKGIILHEDGAGSKPIISYIYYKEFGDAKYFEGLANDVIAMNLDDVICVGAIPLAISDYVAINPFVMNKEEVLHHIAIGFSKILNKLNSLGFEIKFCGGETAELPDIIRTLDISATVYAEVDLNSVITGYDISPGDIIVGLRSGGRASYEEKENSGIMCNGITMARYVLLSNEYSKKYPETSYISEYKGRFKLDDYLDFLGMSIGEALLSPTRIYLPVIMEILKKLKVKALIHNTGGGLTKCLRIGRGIKYIKNNLPEPDPIFLLIQKEGNISWEEMYKVFNMGIGMEIIVDKNSLEEVIKICKYFNIEAQEIGYCESFKNGNALIIETKYYKGKFLK
ncbi:MAG: AIR synthase-related protein [Candidatus Methanomethylicaceae archaeon]